MDGVAAMGPLHDFAAEQAVLGGALADKAMLDRAMSLLRGEFFSEEFHQGLFGVMAALHGRGEPVNPISVKAEMAPDELSRGGGVRYLAQLLAGAVAVDVEQVDYLAGRVADLHRRRQIIDRAKLVIATARLGRGADAQLDQALSELAKTSQAAAVRDGLPMIMWDHIETAVAPDRVVKGLLGEGRLAAFYGAPKSGKTFLVSHLALCVALGWSFFGRPVLQGAVLYVAAEGADGLKNRLIGARIKHRIPAGSDVPFAIIPVAVNLGPAGEDVPKVIAAAAELAQTSGHPVRIIVLDTLARVMPGADENSVADMGATLARADRIAKESGATVILVHHAGKAADAGPRGSTALPGALDTIVRVVKSETGERIATVEAQRDGCEGDVFAFTLEPVAIGEDEDGEQIVTAVLAPVEEPSSVSSPRPREPRGNTGVVFRALQRAVGDSGEDAPASHHIPTGARVVPPERWREYAYKMMAEATPEARQKAFKRGYDQLISGGYVGVWGAYAWVN